MAPPGGFAQSDDRRDERRQGRQAQDLRGPEARRPDHAAPIPPAAVRERLVDEGILEEAETVIGPFRDLFRGGEQPRLEIRILGLDPAGGAEGIAGRSARESDGEAARRERQDDEPGRGPR